LDIRKKINSTYGSGTPLTWRSTGIILVVSIILSLLWYYILSAFALPDTFTNTMRTILSCYIAILITSIGFLFLSIFLYCKPVPMKDRFEIPKKLFLVVMLILTSILLFPLVAIITAFYGISKLMRIDRLVVDIVYSLLCMAIWMMIWYFFFVMFNIIGDTARVIAGFYFVDIHAIVNEITVLHFSMFFSLIISNGITKRIYFALAKVDEDSREKASHQMKLLWSYTILLFSFLAKPLNFPDESIGLFFDALFYSSATISLLSTVKKMRLDSK